MNERDEAIALASRVLDKPYIDPDGDICMLARQLLRETERSAHFVGALKEIRVGLANTGSTPGEWMTRITKIDAHRVAYVALTRDGI